MRDNLPSKTNLTHPPALQTGLDVPEGRGVSGPTSSTDNALVVWDGTTGQLLQDSTITLIADGSGNVTIDNPTAGRDLTMSADDDVILSAGDGIILWPTSTVLILTDKKLLFRDAGLYIYSNADGELTMSADDALIFALDGNQEVRIEDLGGTGGQSLLVGTGGEPTDGKGERILVTTDGYYSQLATYAHSNNVSHCGNFRIAKSRGTAAVPVVVQNGDVLGRLSFTGYAGAAYYSRGHVEAKADGVPSGTSMPTALLLKTGTTSAIERMRISSAGVVSFHATASVEVDTGTPFTFLTTTPCYFRAVANYVSSPLTNTIAINGGTTVYLRIGGSDRLTLTINHLKCETGGASDPTFQWGTNNRLDLCSVTTPRISVSDVGISFFNATPIAKPTVSGARDAPEEALADLLVELENLGLITDSTTAS